MNLKKVVIIPDSFKGSLSAAEVAETCRKSLAMVYPEAEPVLLPLGDGGEGTMEVFRKNGYSKEITTEISDPLRRRINSGFLVTEDGSKAYIESASACGLTLLAEHERNPLETSSFGLGMLIKRAVESGCREITIGLGGSATNDGGMGMLNALGFQFLDSDGKELTPVGKNLIKICSVSSSKSFTDNLKSVRFTGLSDVKNLLLGENGATKIFSPQKGAGANEIEYLEEGMKHYARLMEIFCGKNYSEIPGAGAAGGLGFALLSCLKGEIKSGADFVIEMLRFKEHLQGADLVVTGEGFIDGQTLMGKALSAIANECRQAKVPLIALAGGVKDAEKLNQEGFQAVFSILQSCVSLSEAMSKEMASENLRSTFIQILRILKLS